MRLHCPKCGRFVKKEDWYYVCSCKNHFGWLRCWLFRDLIES